MPLPIIHHPAYDARFSPDHRFPMGKYSALMERLDRTSSLESALRLTPELPATELLTEAHAPDYIAQVEAAEVAPEIEKLIGFRVSRAVADRARYATAGTMLAAVQALTHGIACNTAGGSHHARRAHGAGFCTLNDVAVAALALLREKRATKILIVDLDVHQGDGTAEIIGRREGVFTLSVHAERNWPHEKVASDLDVGLPDGLGDSDYLDMARAAINHALTRFRPDFVFYNAGVDVHAEDRLGRLTLSDAGIRARDRMMIERFARLGVPLCGVIGGGYSKDIVALAARHAILFEEAARVA